ncbi:MAG: RNA polymerase sigma-54 factor, partial [Pseudomonadota bacterium]
MELKQQLRLSQQLVMTPQLQQAIKLLQLSRLELSDLITQEINENPVLDEALEPEEADKSAQEVSQDSSAESETATQEPSSDFDWQDYINKSVQPSTGGSFYESEDRDEFSPVITRKTSFADHLLWQLRLHDLSDQETDIG